jgi:hypothetical protein
LVTKREHSALQRKHLRSKGKESMKKGVGGRFACYLESKRMKGNCGYMVDI